jgi:2-hydroxy-3-oxopropionate reductase
MSATVGFIGLGVMGSPMAVNLAKAGHRVTGFNRSPEKTAALVAAGGRSATSVAETVAGAEVVALMLPDTPDVDAVLNAPDGVLATAQPGTLVIDFSTIRPDSSVGFAASARTHGIGFLDAPVSGGEVGAVNAALSVMVGGDVEDFDRGRPILEAVGATVVHVGPSGSGQTVKAANQLMVAANIQALAEAVVLLRAQSVDLAAALTVLGGGLAGSRVLETKGPAMAQAAYTPGFRLALHHKDLGIVRDSARAAGVALPLAALVGELVGSSVANGDGALDHSALLRGVERLSGQQPSGS